eukprot:9881040-Alexandrium_andersonii.AAC.1
MSAGRCRTPNWYESVTFVPLGEVRMGGSQASKLAAFASAPGCHGMRLLRSLGHAVRTRAFATMPLCTSCGACARAARACSRRWLAPPDALR